MPRGSGGHGDLIPRLDVQARSRSSGDLRGIREDVRPAALDRHLGGVRERGESTSLRDCENEVVPLPPLVRTGALDATQNHD